MSTSALRDRVTKALVGFAWDQWAQMGVFATPQREVDTWAQDPEALLVFTFDVARDEPRLFDEVLDWLRVNGSLISGRRLTRLAAAEPDVDRLVRAAAAWAAKHGSTLRMGGAAEPTAVDPVILSRGGVPPPRTDETFQDHGFLKSPTELSRKSVTPPLEGPVNFAFRLRLLLGVGSRAEIVRFLLTSGASRVTTLAVAEAAVSTKRNVNDALNELASASAISRVIIGNEARYSIDRRRWADFLELDENEIPSYRDWPALLRALTEIHRWLMIPGVETYGDYLRASEARQVIERVRPELTRAGVSVQDHGIAEAYWPSFAATVENALRLLEPATKETGTSL